MIVSFYRQNSAHRFTSSNFGFTMTSARLIDFRTKKLYVGTLTTTTFEIGKPVRVLLVDGKKEFFVSNIKGFLHCGNTYWLIDAHGIKFKLMLQHNSRE